MTLRERLPMWLGGAPALRAVSEPIATHPTQNQFFGQGLSNQPSHTRLLQENIGVPDMATRAIANRVGSLKPLVKVSHRVSDGTTEEDILDDHPLALMLRRPHPNFSWFQLSRLATQYIVTVGEAYLLKVGTRMGITTELHPIPPNLVVPMLSRNVITGYRITDADGRPHDVAATDIVRLFFPDPEQPWASEGYLGPNGITVDAAKFAGQHLRSHYQHDATPPSALEVAYPEVATKFDDVQADRFSSRWAQKYHNRLGSERGGPGLLPFGYKLVQMALQSGADLKPLLEHWSDEELMNFGVPKSLLGKVVSGDRSSAETNQYVFDRYTILPLATLIQEGLTHQLARDFDPLLFVEFEQFVSEDKTFLLEKQTADLAGKVRSINQVREDDGLDPVEWGELPVGALGQVPYDGESMFELGNDNPSALGDDEPEPSKPKPEEQEKSAGKFDESEAITAASVLNGAQVAAIVTLIQNVATGLLQKASAIELMGVAFGIDVATAGKIIGDPKPQAAAAEIEDRVRSFARTQRAAHFTPTAEWERQIVREKKYVPSFEKAIKTVLGLQERDVLRKLKEQMRRARVTASDIFITSEWVGTFEKRVEPIRVKAFEAILGESLAGFGIEEFVFTDEMRFILRQQGALLVKHANATTQNMIAKQLSLGTAEGEGIDALARRIKGVFTQRRKNHARTIARTEMLKASQEAQTSSFEIAKVEKKQWNTSMDGAVRDSHGGPGGTIAVPIVGLREPFILDDGEAANAPGIGAGGGPLSAGNSINCRCFVTPVLEE